MLSGVAGKRRAINNSGMATIDIKQKHTMGRDAARQTAEQIAQQLRSELKASYSWRGDVLEFSCPGAHGGIFVDSSEVRVKVELSFLLRPIRGKIEREIRAYLERLT